jgi:excinuclease ABC subunit C
MKHFGSLKKLRAATVEEIAVLPGIGPRTAEAIATAVAAAKPAAPTVNMTTGEITEE